MVAGKRGMTENVTSLGIGDGGRKIRGIKEPGDPNTVHTILYLIWVDLCPVKP
jgi:hypothetical protein